MLTFSESYFKTEEMNGFIVDAMMKRAWAASLEVYSEIKRICDKHNIEVFADYGTALGAIRHKGFIPWDDDIDLCMKREDFILFHEVVQVELGKYFSMNSLYNNPQHKNAILRINNGEHICFDKSFLDRFHRCPYVVGVDIFPLDYLPDDKNNEEEQLGRIRLVLEVISSIPSDPPYDDKVWRLIDSVERFAGQKVNRDNNLVHELKMIVDSMSTFCSRSDAAYLCHMITYALEDREKYSLDSYSSYIEMPFENFSMNVPVGYEEIMSSVYGSDYMIPKMGYLSHDYPFYKKQRDSFKRVLEKEYKISISDEQMDDLIYKKVEQSYFDIKDR